MSENKDTALRQVYYDIEHEFPNVQTTYRDAKNMFKFNNI